MYDSDGVELIECKPWDLRPMECGCLRLADWYGAPRDKKYAYAICHECGTLRAKVALETWADWSHGYSIQRAVADACKSGAVEVVESPRSPYLYLVRCGNYTVGRCSKYQAIDWARTIATRHGLRAVIRRYQDEELQ